MSPTRLSLVIFASVLPLVALVGCGDHEEQPTGGGGGTAGNGGSGGAASKAPTYYEDIAPIMNTHCANCHIESGIAPFALTTYESAKAVAGLAKLRTETREMPPWNPSNTGDCNTYENARWLTDDQIALIGAWADAGAPEGDPQNAPPEPEAPKGLAKVDLTVDIGFDYSPDDSLADEYRCFVVDPGLAQDAFVTGYEVVPGDKRVVHHVILYTAETPEGDAQADANDAADPGPGYECFGGAGIGNARWTVGWAPGGGAQMYPETTGLRLKAGRKGVIQVHYNTANGSYPDKTKIHLTLAEQVENEAQIFYTGTNDINLPPGQADAAAKGVINIPANVGKFRVWATLPHMHTRGKTLKVNYNLNGADTCLVDVPNWNFHWQGVAIYDQPVASEGGGTITIRCGYDTTKDMEEIFNGEGTDEEMCINYLYVSK
ncbi:MAG: hypothetical protein IPK82_35490 [Polyangiaceae bacterium]|nr:hypothetical protein [Polyangiaceae bacterium]